MINSTFNRKMRDNAKVLCLCKFFYISGKLYRKALGTKFVVNTSDCKKTAEINCLRTSSNVIFQVSLLCR